MLLMHLSMFQVFLLAKILLDFPRSVACRGIAERMKYPKASINSINSGKPLWAQCVSTYLLDFITLDRVDVFRT